jgi:hypothetical protein
VKDVRAVGVDHHAGLGVTLCVTVARDVPARVKDVKNMARRSQSMGDNCTGKASAGDCNVFHGEVNRAAELFLARSRPKFLPSTSLPSRRGAGAFEDIVIIDSLPSHKFPASEMKSARA